MRMLSTFIGGFGLAVQVVSTLVVSVVLAVSSHGNRLLALLPPSGVLLGAVIGVGLRRAKAPVLRQHRELLVRLTAGLCVMVAAILFVLVFVQHRLCIYVGGAVGVAVASVVLGLAVSEYRAARN